MYSSTNDVNNGKLNGGRTLIPNSLYSTKKGIGEQFSRNPIIIVIFYCFFLI